MNFTVKVDTSEEKMAEFERSKNNKKSNDTEVEEEELIMFEEYEKDHL